MKKVKENVIIFGASTRGKYVYEKLKNNYNVKYFCDNDIYKHGKKIDGIEIISPLKVINLNCKVIIASMYYEKISEQLSRIGINNFQVYPSAMEIVISRIQKKGIKFENILALEVFGGNGESSDVYYKNLVKELDIWEINKNFEKQLKNNLPQANIKIVDSFEEIKTTNKSYNFIIIDNPMADFKMHCENFDMFIDIFRILRNEAVIILDVMPNIENIPDYFNYIKTPEHILCRKLFYRTNEPLNICMRKIVETYKDIIYKNNYELEWYFTEERSKNFVYYLVLKVKKSI